MRTNRDLRFSGAQLWETTVPRLLYKGCPFYPCGAAGCKQLFAVGVEMIERMGEKSSVAAALLARYEVVQILNLSGDDKPMSDKPLNHIIPVPEHQEEMGPASEGFVAVAFTLVGLVGWIAAFLTLGYAGLIVPALTFVALILGFIVWVSRG